MRFWCLFLVLLFSLATFSGRVAADTTRDGGWVHAISLIGTPKYAPGFSRTDYVNANAPKGGVLRLGQIGTFDNFNIVAAALKGNVASHLHLVYEQLLAPSLDEPTTEYGMLAEALRVSEDRASVSFRLRPEARWHDGKPVTPDDVVFSFHAWNTHNPQIARYFRDVRAVEITGPREVTFRFKGPSELSLALYVGQITVLPKHWWLTHDANNRPRDMSQTLLEAPLGSGPYRVRSFEPGRQLVLERVANYWGARHPLRVGTENFDQLTIEYFRDAGVMFEALKADRLDFRREVSAKLWAVGYDLAAVADGRLRRDSFPIERLGIMRAIALNLRRDKFQDRRVRRALAMAFNFEEINRNALYGLATPAHSFFPNTELSATSPVGPEERELARALDIPLPAEVLSPPLRRLPGQPTEGVRKSLQRALALLQEAGYRLKDGRLLKVGTDEPLTIEILIEDAAAERYLALYENTLKKIGIATTLRLVDDVQYRNRLRTFDFDMVLHAWAQSHVPGSEQREYWGSQAAMRAGTHNIAGIADPAVDILVERVLGAAHRTDQVAAARLLDRLLLWNHFVIPLWVDGREYVAWWDRFGRPDPMPRYGAAAFPSVWWYDKARAARLQ